MKKADKHFVLYSELPPTKYSGTPSESTCTDTFEYKAYLKYSSFCPQLLIKRMSWLVVWYVLVWCSITVRQCCSESTQKVSESSPGRDDILIPTQYDDDDDDDYDDDDYDDDDDDDDYDDNDDDRSGERLVLPRKDRDQFCRHVWIVGVKILGRGKPKRLAKTCRGSTLSDLSSVRN
jgi:hypothetical protein